MKKETYFWILLGLASILFSSWLMFHTFSYDAKSASMLIGSKAWSDFGAHIPLIRSFSLGNNWPPESPLFPGEPIRYHFLFYFLVGMLEKAGLRIDWALNIPSIVGFAGLIIGIALIAQKVFRDIRVTMLSVIFFLFNGSLSWVRFFTDHPLSFKTITDITTNSVFPSFAPWGEGDITAFWNLNIYTNQRHLGAAFALALLFIGILLYIEKKPLKKQLLFVIPEIAILALLPYFHQPILIILAIFMSCYFILFPKLRGVLLLIGSIGIAYIIPQVLPLFTGPKTIVWRPGYLITPPFTVVKIIWYWIQNIGLHSLFIPIGWLLAPTRVKKITVPLFFLFLIPNLFQFSVDMINNHKFFNFYIIFGSMFTSYALIRLFDAKSKKYIQYIFRTITIVCLFFLTVSGIIDFFPIANDTYLTLQDAPIDETVLFIKSHTPKNAVFLNSTWFYHPASLAGRKIFAGYPYFTWSYGYDQTQREKDQRRMYEIQEKTVLCTLLTNFNISYIETSTHSDIQPIMNEKLLKQTFTNVYENVTTGVHIYDVYASCTK